MAKGNDKFSTATRDYARFDFDALVMEHIAACGKQLSRIDTAIKNPEVHEPQGISHRDIAISYNDMVEHFESLLEPEFDGPYSEWLGKNPRQPISDDVLDDDVFLYAKRKFGKLIMLCHRRGFLFKKVKSSGAKRGEICESE